MKFIFTFQKKLFHILTGYKTNYKNKQKIFFLVGTISNKCLSIDCFTCINRVKIDYDVNSKQLRLCFGKNIERNHRISNRWYLFNNICVKDFQQIKTTFSTCSTEYTKFPAAILINIKCASE